MEINNLEELNTTLIKLANSRLGFRQKVVILKKIIKTIEELIYDKS